MNGRHEEIQENPISKKSGIAFDLAIPDFSDTYDGNLYRFKTPAENRGSR